LGFGGGSIFSVSAPDCTMGRFSSQSAFFSSTQLAWQESPAARSDDASVSQSISASSVGLAGQVGPQRFVGLHFLPGA
jgi:hypothetical protein